MNYKLYEQTVRQLSAMTTGQLFTHYDELGAGVFSENVERMSLTLGELEKRGVRGMRINGKWVLS
jgi:hypothetical protein